MYFLYFTKLQLLSETNYFYSLLNTTMAANLRFKKLAAMIVFIRYVTP